MKRFSPKKSEFLAKDLREGEHVEITTPVGKIRGRVVSREYSALLGMYNTYAVDAEKKVRAYVKMQVLGETTVDKRKEAVSAAALAGSEIWGMLDQLTTESGPVLVRLSLQRSITRPNNAKKYLRAAALARILPEALKYHNLIVTDLGPENVGEHPFDIYIIPAGMRNTDRLITRLKSTAQMVEKYGAEGIRALAEIHEDLGNERYAKRLKEIEEKIKRNEGLGPADYKTITSAFTRALQDYPKTEEFWREWTKDRLEEINYLHRMGIRGRTLQNTERYVKSIARVPDWKTRAIHAAVINKNMAKLWLYAMKRKGAIRPLHGGAAPRRAEPSRRP